MNISVQIFCLLGLFATLAVSFPTAKTNGKRVVCYFGSWAVYRWGKAKITANDIDCSLCSHFVYTFVGLEEHSGKIAILDSYNDLGDEWKVGLLPTLQKKCRASGTKFMVAIGGWNEGSTKYSNVVSDPVRRNTLIDNIINFVDKYDLDGFDLDWEYPGQRGGAANDKENLEKFLEPLYESLHSKGKILSAAVTANALTISVSYNVKHFANHLDFINVMAYDLHGSWEPAAGHHTALYASPTDPADGKHLNVDAAIRRWIELGAPPEKLNLGLGTYGRSATLLNPNDHDIGAPIGGVAPNGWVEESGFYGFNDICFNNQTVWTTKWDDVRKVPYAFSGNKWVGFDDPESIRIKTCYAKEMNLGGIMYWSVETDDFGGNCRFGKFPLIQSGLNALASGCGQSSGDGPTEVPAPVATDSPLEPPVPEQPEPEVPQPDTTTNSPTTNEPPTEATTDAPATEPPTDAPVTTEEPTTSATTTANPTIDGQCGAEGQMLKDPNNCSQYLICVRNINGDFSAVAMRCAPGLVFDPIIKTCNYRSAYTC